VPIPFESQPSEAKRIAMSVVQDGEVDPDQLLKWLEGASDRLIKQEQEIRTLKFHVYMLIFLFIGLPILARIFGG